MSVRSDVGPFAIIPEWLLMAGVSGNAIRLFAWLHRHDGAAGCHPSRQTLASEMGCSRDTVDRVLRELVEAKAVTIAHRMSESGDLTSNEYHLWLAAPERRGDRTDAATGGGTDAATCSRTDAAENESPLNESPLNERGDATASLRAPETKTTTKKREPTIRPITDEELASLAQEYPDFDVGEELANCRNLRYWQTKYASEYGALRNRLRLKRADRAERRTGNAKDNHATVHQPARPGGKSQLEQLRDAGIVVE